MCTVTDVHDNVKVLASESYLGKHLFLKLVYIEINNLNRGYKHLFCDLDMSK